MAPERRDPSTEEIAHRFGRVGRCFNQPKSSRPSSDSADSSRMRRITTAPEGTFDGNPAFSPDGGQIAFVRNTDDGGKSVILVISASGGEPREVTSLHRIGRLAWTADGKRIIFPTGYSLGESWLYSVSSKGGEPERIQFVSSSAFDPAISAKGDKLAYASPIFDTNIWRVPLEGSLTPTKLVGSTRLDMKQLHCPKAQSKANRRATLNPLCGFPPGIALHRWICSFLATLG